jgi:hypothetical protein
MFTGQFLGRFVLLLSLTASVALADVTMVITSAPNSYGGQYTSPYTALISGSITELVACLDFDRHVSLGATNTYAVYHNTGPSDWGAVSGLPTSSTQDMYDAAAILFEGMASTTGTPDRLQGMYSWAIWKLFQNNVNLPGAGTGGVLAGDQAIVDGYISSATTYAANNPNTLDYYVYVPLTQDSQGQWVDNFSGQRFITVVPDGGLTLMLLGGALVGLETLRRKSHV